LEGIECWYCGGGGGGGGGGGDRELKRKKKQKKNHLRYILYVFIEFNIYLFRIYLDKNYFFPDVFLLNFLSRENMKIFIQFNILHQIPKKKKRKEKRKVSLAQ
jgi:hypothetical protein